MCSSFKGFGSADLSILKNDKQEDYWQYSRKESTDILLYTEKSPIYETPTKEKFREGSDVLVRWTDGLLYLGNIIKVDDEYSRCAIKFEDGSQYWSLYKDIHKGPPPNNEIICTVCDTGTSEPPDEIVICDKCSVGYHQYCHVPKIESTVLRPNVSWTCRKCIFASTTKKGGASKKGSKAQAMQVMKQTLPYNLHSLTWDAPHRSNLQQTYCYCGGPGEWYMKMLQCLRCKQWFHEACLQCLGEPLLFGDRFYIFVCALCNDGTEFIRRLSLRWPDIAHLVLFNLTILYGRKYFDMETTVLHFLKDKWSQLQVKGEELTRSSIDEKKQKMLETLQSNKSRFISGKEIKRKTAIWGLRSRVPPPVPVIVLPNAVPITDAVLDSFKSTKKARSQKGESIPIPIKRVRKPQSTQSLSPESPLMETFDTSSQNSAIAPVEDPKAKKKLRKPKKLLRRQLRPRNVRKFVCEPQPGELSDSEDTCSSHRTLNSIIPHPNNFDGPNNPFVLCDQSTNSKSSSYKSTSSSQASKPLSLPPNKHLKSHRRLRSNKKTNSMIDNLMGNSPSKRIGGMTSKNSCMSSNSSFNDLDSSVSSYFGAENRIADGEKFNVLGKRVGSDGCVQYLIEWEGMSS